MARAQWRCWAILVTHLFRTPPAVSVSKTQYSTSKPERLTERLGAAMAVEDAAVLGRLVGLFSRKDCSKAQLQELMKLYQHIRKTRAETTVKTANGNRVVFHMVDGAEQEERDRLLASHDWWDEARTFPGVFADLSYLHELLGFDALKSADEAFGRSFFSRYSGDK